MGGYYMHIKQIGDLCLMGVVCRPNINMDPKEIE
jgi:hypothetical protein